MIPTKNILILKIIKQVTISIKEDSNLPDFILNFLRVRAVTYSGTSPIYNNHAAHVLVSFALADTSYSIPLFDEA